MAIDYSIYIEIGAEFGCKVIKNFLSKAEKLKFKYYNVDDSYFEQINFNAAITRILNINEIYDLNKVKLEIDNETYVCFHCYKFREHQLSLWFTDMFKPKEEELELFLAEYIKLLLYMAEDFPIIAIEVTHNEYTIEKFSKNENKFYLRISIDLDKQSFKQFLNQALKNNMIFYKNNIQNFNINKLSNEIYHHLLNGFDFSIKFKIDEEEGTLKIVGPFSAFPEETISKSGEEIGKIDVNIYLGDLKQNWFKKFPDGPEALDLTKYAKLMLNMVDGFELTELKIGKLDLQ